MKTSRTLYLFLLLALGLAVLTACNSTPARTDAQVASDVQNKIYSDAAVQSRTITVQAANGVVTLSGDVNNDAERAAAANDAGAINGVKTVINNLQVQQAQAAPPPQAQPAPAPAEKPSPRHKMKTRDETASTRHHRRHESQPDDLDNSNMQAQNAPPPAVPAPEPQAQPIAPPQPPPPPAKVTVPAGTQLSVRLNDPLDSERNQVGDTFHGSLSAPVMVDGETVIPSGADVVGRVVNVQSAGRFAGQSLLTLELTSLTVNGRTYNLQTNQWSRAGKGEGKNTATKVGVGTAAGAILGGLIGGGKGAAIGAASGAGAGTGVAAAKKGEQIKLGAEAVLNFQTINTLVVTPQSTNDRNTGRQPLS
jgi:BON domain